MEEKVNKIDWKELSKDFFKTIFSYHFVKRALLLFALLFLILPLSQFLLCVHPILIPSDGKMFWVFYIIINVLIGLAIFLLFKNKYRFGYWEYLFGIATIFLFFTLRCFHLFNDSIIPEWSFTKAFGDCSYLDFPFFLISGTIFISLIIAIFNYVKSFRESNHRNTFLEDNPVNTKQEITDSPYNHLISKIAPALFTDIYESSFSIGVIGPWGTGKSSFLKAVKKAVCDTSIKDVNKYYGTNLKKKPDTIFIEFSPFLNHNEEQVIHEFFTQLSNKLSERSGRLSNLISTYSEKLAKLSRHNSWFSLFNLAKSSRENLSAQELYTKIQEAIEELELKIIVTVDDLDRLNAKEILQVLKLIRNTSNFPNMVFLVAMDKEYVMDALKEEKEYMKKRYLDKFFQLEVYLSIENADDLKSEFLVMLKDVIKSESIFDELKLEVLSPYSVFNSFIQNRRDVKRTINQLRLDFNLLYDEEISELEISIVDLYHLTLLKTYFPNFFYKLSISAESRKILQHEDTVFLITDNIVRDGFRTVLLNDEIRNTFGSPIFVEVDKKDKNKDDKSKNDKIIECIINEVPQSLYLGVLLIRLFADQNSNNPNSMVNSDVYWNYFNSTFGEKGISKRKYNEVLNYEFVTHKFEHPKYSKNKTLLKSLHRSIDLIEPNEDNVINQLLVSIFLCKAQLNLKAYSDFETSCKTTVSKLNYIFRNKMNIKNIFEDLVVENQFIMPAVKSKIIFYIIHNSIIDFEIAGFDFFSAQELEIYSCAIFKEEITLQQAKLCEGNYDLKWVYKDLSRNKVDSIKLNEMYLKFIFSNEENLELFLKQIIQPPIGGPRELYFYNIAQFVTDIFGTIEKYYSRILGDLEESNIQGKHELIEFHELYKICGFYPIYYRFKEFRSKVIEESLIDSMFSENTFTEVYLKVYEMEGDDISMFRYITNNSDRMKILNKSISVKHSGIRDKSEIPVRLKDENFFLIARFNKNSQVKEFGEMIENLSEMVSDYYGHIFRVRPSDKFEKDMIHINGKTIISGYSKQP